MRASDIVKGKDPSLKLKEMENRPLETVKGELDSEKNRIKATYRLSKMEGDLSFRPLSNGEGGLPEAEEKALGEGGDASDVQAEDSAETPAAKNEEIPPKVQRVEPSYRLSDFDFLNLASSSKQSEVAKRAVGEESQNAVGLSIDDIPDAEQVTGQPREGDHGGIDEQGVVEETSGIQDPAAMAGSSEVDDEAITEESQESDSMIETSAGSVLTEEKLDPGCLPENEIPENEIEALYMRARSYLRDVQEKLRRNADIDVDPAISIIRSIIGIRYEMEAEIYQLTVKFGHDEDYFFSHAVNTAIYSLKIGQRLGYSEKALLELGLSALLCDIGMYKIPADVLNKKGKLSLEEINLIKAHPQLSRDALISLQKEFPSVIDAIYKHQERENGQGYPDGLKGSEIPEYAKIIGICDSYEAMTHNRPHKKALMQTDSIRELIGSKNQLFSPKIIKAFLDEISIFPVGSYVRLNNRNIGCVVATNRSNPLKPTIKILCDENGRKFAEPRIIDLKANPILNIEGSISRDEVPV